MPRVLRTSVRPFRKVLHSCRDARGRRVERLGTVNTLCRHCNTQIVYVWDNTPKKLKKRRKNKWPSRR